MYVKMILPSLIEARSSHWRPIKYSLFPPLGLATLAGYLPADDKVVLQDEHVEELDLVPLQLIGANNIHLLRGALRGYGGERSPMSGGCSARPVFRTSAEGGLTPLAEVQQHKVAKHF